MLVKGMSCLFDRLHSKIRTRPEVKQVLCIENEHESKGLFFYMKSLNTAKPH